MENFKEEFKSKKTYLTSRQNRNDIIDISLGACSWETKSMIIMEELAELTQAISKMNRYGGDDRGSDEYYALLEEIADVYICLLMLEKHYGMDLFEINRALNVKLHREYKRCVGDADKILKGFGVDTEANV